MKTRMMSSRVVGVQIGSLYYIVRLLGPSVNDSFFPFDWAQWNFFFLNDFSSPSTPHPTHLSSVYPKTSKKKKKTPSEVVSLLLIAPPSLTVLALNSPAINVRYVSHLYPLLTRLSIAVSVHHSTHSRDLIYLRSKFARTGKCVYCFLYVPAPHSP